MSKFIRVFFILIFSSMLISAEAESDKEISDKNPNIAEKLGFIPGAGQFYNEEYLKGALIIISEIYSISMANKFSSNIVKRNSFIWLSIGIYIYAIIDAYIDAELSSFPDRDNPLKEERR